MHIKITKYTAVMLINSVLDIFYLLSLKEILNSITTNDSMVFKWFIFMATIIFLGYFMKKIKLHVRERYLESSENKITESYIENVFSYNSKSFYNKSIGDYLSYISNDIQAYMESYIKVQPLYHVAIISCVIYAAVALLSGRLFSLAMIAVSLLGLLTMKVFSPMQQKKQEEYIQYRPILCLT